MAYPITGSLSAALATVVIVSGQASAQGFSFREFSDWSFANESGQRALRQGNLDAAARRFQGAIEIARRVVASDPRPLARTYTDYSVVLLLQGRAQDADPLARWALTVREERFGKDSEQAAATMHVLALIASALMDYARAETLLERAVAIWQERLGADHPRVILGLNDLATVYLFQRKYDHAETAFRRVVEAPASRLTDRAISLIGLASLYLAQGQIERVDSTDQQLLVVLARMPSVSYPAVAARLDQLLVQLHKQGRSAEAQALEDAARAARTGENLRRPLPRGIPPARIAPRSKSA
jgi:tetratricopeptide (TPR) repeat protein